MKSLPAVLTIAGSDSGGCAGIQADLRTFAALQVHGASALTAVTAQNTQRVVKAFELPAEIVTAQIDAVAEDIPLRATKTGMLASSRIVAVVAQRIQKLQLRNLVVDPVMVATSGDSLLEADAIEILKTTLLPLARVITPNLREAEILSGIKVDSRETLEAAADHMLRLGAPAVLIKGGHMQDSEQSIDYLFAAGRQVAFPAPRHATPHTHGSGCTLSAAICAYLARGFDLEQAVGAAKAFVSEAIAHSYPIGKGRGPLGHFFSFGRRS